MENSFKEFVYFNKKKVLVVFLLLIIGGGFGLFYLLKEDVFADDEGVVTSSEDEMSDLIKDSSDEEDDDSDTESDEVTKCYFDIKGEVANPGVYSISCDKRIMDAITLAGGLSKNADTSVTNLSKKITDGMVIKIYSKSEVSNYVETVEKENTASELCTSDNISVDSCLTDSDSSSEATSLININTATLEELMTLSGIGEAKAQNIIDYRTTTPFTTIDDIMNVDGIGESIFAKIKDNITV